MVLKRQWMRRWRWGRSWALRWGQGLMLRMFERGEKRIRMRIMKMNSLKPWLPIMNFAKFHLTTSLLILSKEKENSRMN